MKRFMFDRYPMGEIIENFGTNKEWEDKMESEYWTVLKAKLDGENPELQKFTKTGRFTITKFRSKKDLKSETYGYGLYRLYRGQTWFANTMGAFDGQRVHGTKSSERKAALRKAGIDLDRKGAKVFGEAESRIKKKLEMSAGCINLPEKDLVKLHSSLGDGEDTQVYIINEMGDLIYCGLLIDFYDIVAQVAYTLFSLTKMALSVFSSLYNQAAIHLWGEKTGEDRVAHDLR
jgi:hypothetical protein